MGFTDLLRPWHIILIVAVALLMFGPGKLAGLGKSLGAGLKSFKDGVAGPSDTQNQTTTVVQPAATVTPVATTEIPADELAEFRKYQALKAPATEQS